MEANRRSGNPRFEPQHFRDARRDVVDRRCGVDYRHTLRLGARAQQIAASHTFEKFRTLTLEAVERLTRITLS
jgi:hypothetical protein